MNYSDPNARNDQILPRSRKHLNWLGSPLFMVLSLLGALGICIGHDQFYRSLNGQHVDTTLSQTWVSRIATGMAFLIQTLLVLAAGIAYVQSQWMVLKSNAFKIGQVDNLTNLLMDLRGFASIFIWTRTPLLALVAGVTWLLPLTVIITPSTLTVTSDCRNDPGRSAVSQPSFNTSAYSWFGAVDTQERYEQQSAEVSRVTFATATSGKILSIPHEYQNMTYDLQFYGPAIQCFNANQSVSDNVETVFEGLRGSGGAYTFASVVPGADQGILSGNWTMDSAELQAFGTLDKTSPDVARIFFVSALGDCDGAPCDQPWRNVTECNLHNASYEASFDFSNFNQTANVRSLELHEKLAAIDTQSGSINRTNPASNVSAHESYQAVMQAFGTVMVGVSYLMGQNTQTSYSITTVDWYSLENTQHDLEQLFQNITLSLMSSPLLTKNSTDADQIPINITTCPSVFTYHPRDLYISYGAGLLATFISVGLGLVALLTNKATYSNKFSTYIRTTKDLDLKHLIISDDSGADPLPRGMKEKRIMLGMNDGESMQGDLRGEYIGLQPK